MVGWLSVADVALGLGVKPATVYWYAHHYGWRRLSGRPTAYWADDVFATLGRAALTR